MRTKRRRTAISSLLELAGRGDEAAVRAWLERHPAAKVGEVELECCGLSPLSDEAFFEVASRARLDDDVYAAALGRGPAVLAECLSRGLVLTTAGKAFDLMVARNDVSSVRSMIYAGALELFPPPALGECACLAAHARTPEMISVLLDSDICRRCERAAGPRPHVNARRILAAARGDDQLLARLRDHGVPPLDRHVCDHTPFPTFRDAAHYHAMLRGAHRHFTPAYVAACALVQCAHVVHREAPPGSLAVALAQTMAGEVYPEDVARVLYEPPWPPSLRAATPWPRQSPEPVYVADLLDLTEAAHMRCDWHWSPSRRLVRASLCHSVVCCGLVCSAWLCPKELPRVRRLAERHPREVYHVLRTLQPNSLCAARLAEVQECLARWQPPPGVSFTSVERVSGERSAASRALHHALGVRDLVRIALDYVQSPLPPPPYMYT